MDISLSFDRGNNVYTAMHLSSKDMAAIQSYRRDHAQDYSFLYDRALLAEILGHEPAAWSPESFTAYDENTRLLVRVDNGPEQEVVTTDVNVVFGEVKSVITPPEGPPDAMVVLGCQGGRLIDYTWSGLEGDFDPSRLTLRVTTQEHRGETLLVIEEVSYQGYLAEKQTPDSPRPDWLWEPSFFTADDLR